MKFFASPTDTLFVDLSPLTGTRDQTKSALLWLAVVLLATILFGVYQAEGWNSKAPRVLLSPPPHNLNDSLPPAQFDAFVARYGPATFEEQYIQGTLRRPLFTKWLDYEPENLRIVFLAAENPGAMAGGPVDRSWILVSYIDSKQVRPVSASEAAHRLSSRQR
jgi:hypothetical protein